jgi:hypothetical protein
VSERQQHPEEKQEQRWTSDSDARLATRLKQLLDIPGISDKDRQLLQRNLQRLIDAQERRTGS